MQLIDKRINIDNSTLNTLVTELKQECQNILSLINQLELSDLTDNQKGEILSELLVASIHLNSHCDEDFQELIADELEHLRDEK